MNIDKKEYFGSYKESNFGQLSDYIRMLDGNLEQYRNY